MRSLIQFAKDTKEINPNLLNDVKCGFIKPSKVLEETIRKYYKRLCYNANTEL